MSDIIIKPMETDAEIEGKAYVHWKAWQEAYAGIIDPGYLAAFTLEKCVKNAYRWRDNFLVAKDGEYVVGFAGYGASGDHLPDTGEVFALYILKGYYDSGLGRRLMDAALEKLAEYDRVSLWVLKDNKRAIRFYEKCGFILNGTGKPIRLGTETIEIRMILEGRKQTWAGASGTTSRRARGG